MNIAILLHNCWRQIKLFSTIVSSKQRDNMKYAKIVNLTAHPVVLLDKFGVYQDPTTKQFFAKKEDVEVVLTVAPNGIVPRVVYSEITRNIEFYSSLGVSDFPVESLMVQKIEPLISFSKEILYIVSGQVAAAVKLPNVVAPSKIVRDADDLKIILGCISFRCEA